MSERLDSVLRRALDVSVAGVALVLLAPLLGVIAAAVRLTSRGPALFVQERIGQGRVPFRLLKFRSMVAGAPAVGPAVTVGTDPRITRVGALLRRSKLDELPQLVNVLRGDMSLVGPRPEVPRYLDLYRGEAARLLTVRPGLTDPASVHYRDEAAVLATYPDPERAYREIVLPHKMTLSLAYLDRRTVWTDLGLVVSTVLRILLPGGVARAVALMDVRS